jgi:NADP-dependent 3-hydroxy acid dehydrogenase YdfG
MDSKVIVITGASSGIGASLARQLGTEGHKLVLGARREKELNAVAAASGQAKAVVTDVLKRADVDRLRDQALEAHGHIDVWVNNAGRGIGKKVLELTESDFDEMMAINVKSALFGMQAVVPHFQERKEGQLINVSSFLGRVPLASYRSAYNAAKSALNALTANLRMDLAASHPAIQVCLVMPGPVATDFANASLGGTPMVPPPRLTAVQTADDVADVIAGIIENPRAEVFTTPTLKALSKRYFDDVAQFEAGMAAPSLAAPNLAALAERLKKRE